MLDTHARKYVSPLIEGGANVLVKAKISPNQATLMAFGVGLTVPILYLTGNSFGAVTALWLSGYLDAVDGAIARQTKMTSPLGTLLDILFDRVVECAALIGIAALHPEARFSMVILMSTIILSMTIFLTTGALTPNNGVKTFRYQAGLAERTEGFIMITLLLLLPKWTIGLTIAFAVMIGITIVQRFIEATRLFRE